MGIVFSGESIGAVGCLIGTRTRSALEAVRSTTWVALGGCGRKSQVSRRRLLLFQ